MRTSLSWLAALAAATLALGCAEPSPPRPRNVLILSIDTLRADALGVDAGSDGTGRASITPNLDRLARRGVYFTRAYTPLPRTTPGFGSLLTGLIPAHHGSREVGDPVTSGTPLAELLRQHGHATLAVSANAAAGPQQGLDRGFERFVSFADLVSRHGAQINPYTFDMDPAATPSAEAVTDEALALLDRRPEDRPFTLWVVYLEPHFLYYPSSAWGTDPAGNPCLELYAHYTAHRGEAGRVFSDVGGVASHALAACKRLYAEEVADTDRQAGRLLDGLAERGLLDDTLIVLNADHGENHGEGGLYYEHGNNLAEAALRVPLALAGPGLPAGKRVTTPVGLIDVLPTVLGLVGVPEAERPEMDGLDLAPLFTEGGRPERRLRERVLVAESGSAMWNEAVDRLVTGRAGERVCINRRPYTLCREPAGGLALFDHVSDPKLLRDLAAEKPEVVADLAAGLERWTPDRARRRAAVSERFKLVLRPRFEGGWSRRLIDLAADPQETRDVASEHPEALASLAAALERYAAEMDEPARDETDPEREETLRSLGYVH
jgi:arylsulfatase A-like enzyme